MLGWVTGILDALYTVGGFMNNRIKHTIYKSEQMYEKRKTPNTAFLLILRYIEGAYILSDKNIYLQKALYIATNAHIDDLTDIRLKLLEVYINMELQMFDEAENTLNRLMVFKNWYKDNGSYEYIIMLWLTFKKESIDGHNRRAKKYYKLYSDYIEDINNNKIYKVLEALILKKYTRNDDIIANIIEGLSDTHCRSPLFFYITYQIFLEQNDFRNINNIICKVIKWATIQGIENSTIDNQLELCCNKGLIKQEDYMDLLELMYNLTGSNKLLDKLCTLYIESFRQDNKALNIFVLAKQQQRHIKNIDLVFVHAAYQCDYYDIDAQTVQNVITDTSLADTIKAFLYHLVITNTNMKYILRANKDKIITFGERAFDNKNSGLHYNSIYKFLFEEYPDNEKLQKYIFNQLFSYEIKVLNPNIKYLWVSEQEKSEIQAYVVKSDSLVINVATSNFTIYALGARLRYVYPTTNHIEIKKQLINMDKGIYSLLWNKGFNSTDLAISITQRYMQGQFLTSDGAQVLKYTLESTDISNPFRMQIGAMLGKFYANKKDYSKAYGYFSILDLKQMRNNELDSVVTTFIAMNDFEKAIMILRNMRDQLSDMAKLELSVAAIKNNVYPKEIAHVSADLILKGRSEKELIDHVICFYDSALNNLIKIRKMLKVLNSNTDLLDEKILKKALYTQQVDDYIKKLFIDYYKNSQADQIIKDYIEYFIYNILTKGENIDSDLLHCLESEYAKNNDETIGYALSSVYIENNMEINTIRYPIIQKSIEDMIKKNILLPIFKKYKDKDHHFSYLEKNKPFVYFTLPDKEVYLHYKVDGESDFHTVKMNYMKYGIYLLPISLFYNEVIEYYIEESGIHSEIFKMINKDNFNIEENNMDEYYELNNAIIYSNTLNYLEVEKIIINKQNKKNNIKWIGHIIK